MNTKIEKFEQHQKTNTESEYWLGNYHVVKATMKKTCQLANEGEILVTEGPNGCVALIVRIESANINLLAYKYLRGYIEKAQRLGIQ